VALPLAREFDGLLRAQLCHLLCVPAITDDVAQRAMLPLRCGGTGVVATVPIVGPACLASMALVLNSNIATLPEVRTIIEATFTHTSNGVTLVTARSPVEWVADLQEAWSDWERDTLVDGVRVTVAEKLPVSLAELAAAPRDVQSLLSEPLHLASMMRIVLSCTLSGPRTRSGSAWLGPRRRRTGALAGHACASPACRQRAPCA
jgi:hypothetical protein